MMNRDYDAEIQGMEAEILRLASLRSAQRQGSSWAEGYQGRIDEVTARCERLRSTRPALEQIDGAVVDAAGRVDGDPASKAATVTGAAGALLLLLSFYWTPTVWLPVVGGLLLGVAGGVTWIGVRRRAAAHHELTEAQAILGGYEQDRRQLSGESGRSRAAVRPEEFSAFLGGGAGVDSEGHPVLNGYANQRRLGGRDGGHVVPQLHDGHAGDDATGGRR